MSEVELEKSGAFHDPQQVAAAVAAAGRVSDVVVVVHGWNNDVPAARRTYARLLAGLDTAQGEVPAAAGRSFAAVGVLWPSIRWADDVAGGGAGTLEGVPALQARISESVEDAATADRLARLAGRLDTDPAAQREFLEVLSAMVPDEVDEPDGVPPDLVDPPADARGVLARAASASDLQAAPRAGGGAAGFSLGGLAEGARRLLNTVTFYTMKARAGTVGTRGVAPLVDRLAAAGGPGRTGPRVHLVGHSFGARVVSAAAQAATAPVQSVALLQGAFSHYGFSDDWDGRGSRGMFWPVPGRLHGPMVVTCTKNDTAVGLAYAVASRLAQQVAAGLPGGPDDVYGGIGRNGALRTAAVAGPDVPLGEVGTDYTFAAGRITNLRADRFITNHSDVTGPEVSYAVMCAMAAR